MTETEILANLFKSLVKKQTRLKFLDTKESVESFCNYFSNLGKFDDGSYYCCSNNQTIDFYIDNLTRIRVCWNCFKNYENHILEEKRHKSILTALQYTVYRLGREDVESTFKEILDSK